jgi:DNA primase
MHSKAYIQKIKEAASIREVALSLGLEVDGANRMRCLHPENHAHGDRTPSMSISEEYNSFRCWVCNDVKGDVFDLVRLYKGVGFSAAVQEVASLYAIVPDESEGMKSFRSKTYSSYSSGGTAGKQSVSFSNKNTASIAQERLQQRVLMPDEKKREVIRFFLNQLTEPKGDALRYLVKRKIFIPVQKRMRLRYIEDYQGLNELLKKSYSIEDLQEAGLMNDKGNLRFYRHPLIFPYLNREGKVVYFQARAIDKEVQPKELSLKGRIWVPYNAPALDEKAGLIYICEGVIDTLTLLQHDFPAIGVPGVSHFKREWIGWMENKRIMIAFDADKAGQEGAQKLQKLLAEYGKQAEIIKTPDGTNDINESFGSLI